MLWPDLLKPPSLPMVAANDLKEYTAPAPSRISADACGVSSICYQPERVVEQATYT